MFIDHGDVSVVKTGPSSFWVDFESFDSEESICAQGTLGRIKQMILQKHKGLIRTMRDYGEAQRFPKISNQPSHTEDTFRMQMSSH